MSFDWKSVVGTVAPTIATALGGPFAGMATKTIMEALGVSSEAEIEKTLASASPDHLLALRNADNDFKVRMRELDIKEEDLEAKDRHSARGLFKVNIWPQIILSVLFVSGYFVVLYFIGNGFIVPSVDMKEAFILLLGLLTREIPTIMQFWFGTSSGSKDKTSIIGEK